MIDREELDVFVNELIDEQENKKFDKTADDTAGC